MRRFLSRRTRGSMSALSSPQDFVWRRPGRPRSTIGRTSPRDPTILSSSISRLSKEETLSEAIAAEQPTLVLLPSRFVNGLVADGLVASIPTDVIDGQRIDWTGIPAPARRSLGSLSDHPAMVPVTCQVPICCYRLDLLEASGKQIPHTWSEYDALARSLSEWAGELTAVEPWGEPFRTTTYLARAISAAKQPAQYSVELNVGTGEPLIASAPFVRALEEVAALRPHLATGVETLSPDDCLRELREGRAAMGIVWETVPSGTTATGAPSAPTTAGLLQTPTDVPLAFAPLPGRDEVYDRETERWGNPPTEAHNRPALCGPGGFTVCVLASASEQQVAAAWDLWGLLESYQIDGTIQRLPGNAVIPPGPEAARQGDASSLENWQPSRAAVTASLQNASLTCELPVYGREQLRTALSTALEAALTKELSPAEALEQTARDWTTAMDQLGRSKVLNSYRQRLGLSGLLD